MKHLLSINDLNRETIQQLLDRAQVLLEQVVQQNTQLNTLSGQVITHLFFEPSTRTQYSFTIAAQRLGAFVLNPPINLTSMTKGESLLDMVRTFIAMGTQLFVVRHREEKTAQWLADSIQQHAIVINGGDGCHQHPTQALLDLLTIAQYKKQFEALNVAIVGDIVHSRVARSLISGLHIMGCQDIRLIAPPELLDAKMTDKTAQVEHSIEKGLVDADVVVCLRIQRERMADTDAPEPDQFFKQYGLTPERLALAKPTAIVLHPGPINQGVEIDPAVVDSPQSMILQQVTNGVAMRMAVIEWLCA